MFCVPPPELYEEEPQPESARKIISEPEKVARERVMASPRGAGPESAEKGAEDHYSGNGVFESLLALVPEF